MAIKELKQNLEQCSAVVIAGATITVAILEQRQRKFSTGYMQNRDLQFPNLTYAHPRILFTLVFKYKKSTHHMKKRQGINIEGIKRKNQSSRENKSAPVKKLAELFLDSIFIVLYLFLFLFFD